MCSYMYMYSMQKLCWLNKTTKCVVVTFTNQILFTWWYNWLLANVYLEQLASQAHLALCTIYCCLGGEEHSVVWCKEEAGEEEEVMTCAETLHRQKSGRSLHTAVCLLYYVSWLISPLCVHGILVTLCIS